MISKEEAISEINNGTYEYYVSVGSKEVRINVVSDRYLRTDPDETIINNLDFLPVSMIQKHRFLLAP